MYELKSIYWVLEKNIDKLCSQEEFGRKDIFLFGANLTSEQSEMLLTQRGCHVRGIMDNDKKKIAMVENGELPLFCGKYKLQLPESVAINNNSIVLVGIHDYPAACSQLMRLGYDCDTQVVNLLDYSDVCDKTANCLSNDEIRAYQCQLLDFVDKMSRQKGYRYYLCGGTLLGSVRHKGYIPWDDDIDIFMPVADLERFIADVKDCDEYGTLNFENQGLPYMFTRLVHKKTVLEELHYPFVIKSGISIDIFPLSGFPDDENEVRDFKRELVDFRKMYDMFFRNYSMSDKKDDFPKIREAYKSILNRYDFDRSNFAGYIMIGRLEKEILPKHCFQQTIYTQFEGKEYPTFSGYDMYLRQLYGDYMVMPPESQRKHKHNFRAWSITE